MPKETYAFPPRAIVHVIYNETESKLVVMRKESSHFSHEEEIREAIHEHTENIRKLSTYEEINAWLLKYRGLSLQEWVDTL